MQPMCGICVVIYESIHPFGCLIRMIPYLKMFVTFSPQIKQTASPDGIDFERSTGFHLAAINLQTLDVAIIQPFLTM
jgi:hypothetical protein